MSEIYSARARIFLGAAQFSASQIDAAASTSAPKIPMPTSTAPYPWRQIHTEGDVSVKQDRPVNKYRTSTEKGVQKIVGARDDGMNVTFPLADISIINLVELVQEQPGSLTASKSWKLKSLEGVDFSGYAVPLLIYHQDVDEDNESDVPKIGTGGDAHAILIFLAVPPQEVTSFGSDQEILELTMNVITANGTTEKSLYGVRLDLANTTAEV